MAVELTQGVIWAEPDADPKFIEYVEAILNCKCCQNNYDDPEHRHNEVCNPSYQESAKCEPETLLTTTDPRLAAASAFMAGVEAGIDNE